MRQARIASRVGGPKRATSLPPVPWPVHRSVAHRRSEEATAFTRRTDVSRGPSRERVRSPARRGHYDAAQ